MRKFLVKAVSTVCFIGYLPLIPGTFGSIAGLFLFYLIKDKLGLGIGVTLVVIAVGFLVSGEAERIFHKKDPKFVVIDEVAGMLLSLLFLPYSIELVIIAFFLFRILDTLKTFPAGKIQELKGAAGIMGDDIIAGLYTNILLQIVLRFASSRIS